MIKTNEISSIDGLYCKVMGKMYKVAHIATSVEEANNYCEMHSECGVIGERVSDMNGPGLIFIAPNNQVDM